MKYCVYCGHQVDKNTKECPYCYEDISEETTEKLYHSNIECIKCNSTNVDYTIKRRNRNKIVYEEQIYTCKECGKQFRDKNRLGYSFSNSPQIILNGTQQKILKWLIIIAIACGMYFSIMNNKKTEEENWVKLDCTGMQTITFKQIKDGAPYDDDKYKGNSYIFTTTIQEIKGNEIITPIEEGDYSGSYIKVNKEELETLSNYKTGDKITFCGTVRKISMYHKVYVDNATIIK